MDNSVVYYCKKYHFGNLNYLAVPIFELLEALCLGFIEIFYNQKNLRIVSI
jgi:hypothetical protein